MESKFEKILRRTIDLIFDHKIAELEEGKLKEVKKPKILEELDREVDRLTTGFLEGLPGKESEISLPEEGPKITKTVGYCVNCFVKHYGRARIYAGEAIDFYERDEAISERVQHKAQALMDELAGLDDDTSPDMPSFLWHSWREADKLRKWVEERGLNIGLGAESDLRHVEGRLLDLARDLREGYKRWLVKEAVTDLVKKHKKPDEAVRVAEEYEGGKIDWARLVSRFAELGMKDEFMEYYKHVKELVGEKK